MNKVPSLSGFLAWSRERFPPVTVVSAYLLFALCAALVRRELNGQVTWSKIDLLSGFGLALHFLVLRVLDEHKDYELDRVAHPQRVLQRGLITLDQLKLIGALAAIGTLAITILIGSMASLCAWAAMIIWTLLMTAEFFCPTWLRKRLFLYSVSHLLVISFMITWAATLAHPDALTAQVLPWLMTVTPINGLIYEILRKTKGRDEEIADVETFSRLWGPTRAASLAIGLHLLSVAVIVAFSTIWLMPPLVGFVPLFLALILSMWALLLYMKTPNARRRKANEGAGALYVLIAYVSLILFAAVR